MSLKTRKIVAYSGIVLAVVYFMVVVGYFFTKTPLMSKVWEALIILSAPIMLLVLLSIFENVEVSTKSWKTAAVVFMACTTVITSLVHFGSVLSIEQTMVSFSVNDSLAWGLFMGLAFIFSSCAVPADLSKMKAIRITLLICGGLCLLGLSGPISGVEPLWFIAVAGYGVGTPVICVQLLSLYKKEK